MIQSLTISWLLIVTMTASAGDFHSDWHGSRTWIGPEFWANRLQDWRIEQGILVGDAARDRTVVLLTHSIDEKPNGLAMNAMLEFQGKILQPHNVQGGFRLGIRGAIDDYRHALVGPTRYLDVGIRADGRLFIGEKLSTKRIPGSRFDLKLTAVPQAESTLLTLIGLGPDDKTESLIVTVPSEKLIGGIGLIAIAPRREPAQGEQSAIELRYHDWSIRGATHHPERRFGPILWSQYTLSDNILKLTAQMPPIGPNDSQTVSLEVQQEQKWVSLVEAPIHALARTATFRLPDWDSTATVPYRLVYRWQGEDHFWEGTICADPMNADLLSVGVFACDHGYLFPHVTMTRNVAIQNPDLLYFAGDQIYEGYGGFGVERQAATPVAMLDYLRKYYQFGWTWRELLRNRPSVIIPDDHDMFQGNIWGQGGRKLPANKNGTFSFVQGGYIMPPDWVNAVQRTQTAHLPDPIDPMPVEQGIGVYFTKMNYGGVSFAIIEDRKFKTGPGSLKLPERKENRPPEAYDVEGAELLGQRQERFLDTWMKDDATFKVVLSQTIFCKVTTHTGAQLQRNAVDFDSGAWPQTPRNHALKMLGPKVVMLHGDQHLGALVRHGIDEYDDGPIGFMVPGTANGFPRAWWPDADSVTGRFRDGLGNRIRVLAVGNPEKGSNTLSKAKVGLEAVGHRKGSGHGIVRFNKNAKSVTFELWRYQFDATQPKANDQFEGFPQTIQLK